MPPRVGPPASPVVDQVYRLRLNSARSWRAFRHLLLNIIVAAFLLIDLQYGIFLQLLDLHNTLLGYMELVLLVICILNALVDLIRYLHLTFSNVNVELNEKQKRLLAVKENEVKDEVRPSFSISPKQVGYSPNRSYGSFYVNSSPSYSPVDYGQSPAYSVPARPSYSVSPGYRSDAASPGYVSNTSGLSSSYHSPAYNASMSPHLSNSYNASRLQPNPSPFSQDSFGLEALTLQDSPLRRRFHRTNEVLDLKSLNQLLKEEDTRELQRTMRQSEDIYSRYDMPSFPYQMACRSPQSVSLNDEDSSDTFHSEEIWRRLNVGSAVVEVWIERLRRFLSQTIMCRVSKEIRKLNKQLRRLGLDEMEIGEVSIPTLKQIAMTKGHQLESLNSVIQFLDITPNQNYLVARIHELGKGGCMSDFNWNGGMEYKSKAWDEHLPTDCAIVIHCLCTYLDARLPPHPKFPDGRTFTSQHFLRIPDKPNLNKESLIVYQSTINPPHFKVISGGDIYDVPKGRNNMFQAILLFLYFIKLRDGMLDRVSLGMSGINILWVLDNA